MKLVLFLEAWLKHRANVVARFWQIAPFVVLGIHFIFKWGTLMQIGALLFVGMVCYFISLIIEEKILYSLEDHLWWYLRAVEYSVGGEAMLVGSSNSQFGKSDRRCLLSHFITPSVIAYEDVHGRSAVRPNPRYHRKEPKEVPHQQTILPEDSRYLKVSPQMLSQVSKVRKIIQSKTYIEGERVHFHGTGSGAATFRLVPDAGIFTAKLSDGPFVIGIMPDVSGAMAYARSFPVDEVAYSFDAHGKLLPSRKGRFSMYLVDTLSVNGVRVWG